MFSRFYIFLILIIPSLAVAERLVELPIGSKAVRAFSSEHKELDKKLLLNLPVENKTIPLFVERESELEIPIYGNDGVERGRVRSRLSYVTDYGSFYGVVTRSSSGLHAIVEDASSERIYQVTPLNQDSAATGEVVTHAVAEMAKEDLLDVTKGCKTLDHGRRQAESVLSELSGSWRTFELLAVSSSEFSGSRTDDAIVQQIRATVAAANLFFEPLRLVVELVGLQVVRVGGDDPYALAQSAESASGMLYAVREQWLHKATPQRDAVAVFGLGSYQNTFGLAWSRTSCVAPEYSYLFVAQGGTGEKREGMLAGTLAHELGHILGMSHDNVNYPSGPSLMWPLATADVNGFSAYSISQFLSHAGEGTNGGSCLAPRADGGGGGAVDTKLYFEGGERSHIRIKEGQERRISVKVLADNGAVNYSAQSLPSWVSLDTVKGELRIAPSYTVANRRSGRRSFVIRIKAEQGGITGEKEISVTVSDVNTPPVLRVERRILGNGAVLLRVRGDDSDKYDRVKPFLISAQAMRLMGVRSYIEGGVLIVRAPAAVKRIRVGVRDRTGARVVKIVKLY